MADLQDILNISMSRHKHLCPRQVLGARIGLAGKAALGLELPRSDKRLMVIIETDGCFADGIEAATLCTVGHRTMRIEDYGKIAATFIDTKLNKAIRIAPQNDVRQQAYHFSPGEPRHYYAQLQSYQIIPDDQLLTIQSIILNTSIDKIVSRAGVRVNCDSCGEEIINQREVHFEEQVYCHACAFGGYYTHYKDFESSQMLFERVLK